MFKESSFQCTLKFKIMQRIGTCLRLGGPDEIHLERFVEALQDPESGLTHPALVGTRKQSIEDIERLFGERLIAFMDKKQYTSEASYLRLVRNWRRATDERGISDSQRQEFSKNFLKFIVEGLIPWSDTLDYSSLEVNRWV